MSTSVDFLNRAAKIQSERAREYERSGGERSAAAMATAFNAITGREGDRALQESDVWLLLQILKQVRLFTAPGFHRDSAEDNVSYAALLAECRERETMYRAPKAVAPKCVAPNAGPWNPDAPKAPGVPHAKP